MVLEKEKLCNEKMTWIFFVLLGLFVESFYGTQKARMVDYEDWRGKLNGLKVRKDGSMCICIQESCKQSGWMFVGIDEKLVLGRSYQKKWIIGR